MVMVAFELYLEVSRVGKKGGEKMSYELRRVFLFCFVLFLST